jgi:hypothetical protein
VSTLIATSELSDAKVSQIRLILGLKHSGCGGITYQLTTKCRTIRFEITVNQTLLADIQNEIYLILMPMHLL